MNTLCDYACDAVLSDDGQYRYVLTRAWGPRPWMNLIMLNPSTADASEDDPTIRRCKGFARSLGYGGIVVTNLFAYRATDPRKLRIVEDPVGPDNNEHLVREATRVLGHVYAAWGALANPDRVQQVLGLIPGTLKALGLTKHGRPRHPLYLRGDTTPVVYRAGQ